MKHLRGAAFDEYYKNINSAWLLLCVGFCTVLIIWIGDFPELASHPRSPASRVKADLRSLATGIESYYVDHDAYPAFAVVPNDNGLPYTHLSSPVSYISTYFTDPFVESPSSTYCYWTDPTSSGWIAWSAGPDGDYDITYNFVETTYNPKSGDNQFYYLKYDPTNGTASSGDIYRVKQ